MRLDGEKREQVLNLRAGGSPSRVQTARFCPTLQWWSIRRRRNTPTPDPHSRSDHRQKSRQPRSPAGAPLLCRRTRSGAVSPGRVQSPVAGACLQQRRPGQGREGAGQAWRCSPTAHPSPCDCGCKPGLPCAPGPARRGWQGPPLSVGLGPPHPGRRWAAGLRPRGKPRPWQPNLPPPQGVTALVFPATAGQPNPPAGKTGAWTKVARGNAAHAPWSPGLLCSGKQPGN